MATETILERMRAITGITTAVYPDASVTSYAEPICLSRYNTIMGTSLTITTHTTGTAIVDEALSWLVASWVYTETQRGKMNAEEGMPQWIVYEQQAFKYMYEIDPSKIKFNPQTAIYYPSSEGGACSSMISGDWEDGVSS